MKSHLTKISLAVLSTVFLLGCQDMGSGPLGPEGPQFDKKGTGDCDAAKNPDNPAFPGHCHGDDEPSPGQDVPVDLTFSAGLSATKQSVTLAADGRIQGEGIITLVMDLSATHTAGIGACVPGARNRADADADPEAFQTDPFFTALFETLKTQEGMSLLLKSLWLEIDQNTLDQGTLEDDFNLTYDENGEAINVIMGQGLAETVVFDVSETFPTPPFTVTFTGGEIRLRNTTAG